MTEFDKRLLKWIVRVAGNVTGLALIVVVGRIFVGKDYLLTFADEHDLHISTILVFLYVIAKFGGCFLALIFGIGWIMETSNRLLNAIRAVPPPPIY